MRVFNVTAILSLFLSNVFLSNPSFSHEPLRLAKPGSVEDTKGILLLPGRPDFLKTVKFFEDSSSFQYAVLSAPFLDTILIIARDVSSALPQCWLLAVESDQIVGSKELVFDTTYAGFLIAEGEFRWADRPASDFGIRYAPSERRVWCNWGEDNIPGTPQGHPIVSFGIRVNSSVIFGSNLDYSRHRSIITPLNISVVPTFRLFSNLALETRIGILVPGVEESFGGEELGVFLRVSPFGKDAYLLIGVMAEYIFDYEQGMSYHVVINGGEYTFLSLGAGMQFLPGVFVDLSYCFSQDKTFGHVDLIEGSTRLSPAYMKTVDGILKFGICFYL